MALALMRMRNPLVYQQRLLEASSVYRTLSLQSNGKHCLKASNLDFEMNNSTNANRRFASLDVIFIVVAMLIILFNGIVVFIMTSYKSLHNAQNGLLTSLAVSDFSSGLIGIPLAFACTYSSIPQYYCVLCIVSYCFFKFISISTVLHILAIIGERCFLIVDPILHRRLRTTSRRSNRIIMATIWLTSFVASSLPYIWLAKTFGNCHIANNRNETWNTSSIYELSCFVLFFVIPLVLITVFLAKIFIAVHQFTRRKSRRCVDDMTQQSQLRHAEMRIFLVLLFLFVLFIVCWLPYFAVTTLTPFVTDAELPLWLQHMVAYCRSVTSLLNPLVYAFYKDDVYKAIKQKLRRFDCCRSSALQNRLLVSGGQKSQVPLVPFGTST